jgi:putative endonuclease
MDVEHRKGYTAEHIILDYLESKGFKLRAKNWRSGKSEVDLVMMDHETLVFVEVKTRNASTYLGATDVLNNAKIDALMRARDAWWDEYGELPFRIDLVVLLHGEAPEIKHYVQVDL